ncbi:MAG: hypothetical protein A2V98_26065 [Planctomycetes bacterium RBG_16_64_12]|nr:MAG: hypothetical protein A2V98_26065 [Planctomycetes bacterium RBG_16_64_12]
MLFPLHDDSPITCTPLVTYAIVAVNAAAFLGSLRLSPLDRETLWYGRGFVPARIAQLVDPRPLEVDVPHPVPNPFRPDLERVRRIKFEPIPRQILLSLFTCMFLHGGWLHLIGNMWFLWIFGNNVEDRLGHVAFLLFYLSGGLLASACHWMIEAQSTTPVIGASGAVATILGAYAITWPWARVKTLLFLFVIITIVDLPAMLVLGAWFLIQLLSATSATNLELGGGVAWWAHVGGFLAGLTLMPALSLLTGATDGRRDPEGFDLSAWRE